jgi:predicted permease
MISLIRRLIHFWRRRREADALAEELEMHRHLRQAQLEAQGMCEADAAKTSRRLMGNTTLARDDARDVWAGRLGAAWLDVRHGLHALRANRRFAVVSCLTLTLCLGANLLVFTIVNALWLRPPPVADPGGLVMITNPGGMGSTEGHSWAEAGLKQLRDQPIFAGVAGQVATSGFDASFLPHIVFERSAGAVEALAVTPQYFSVAGVRLVGRDFSLDDDRPDAAPVAILSDRLWGTGFGRDASVIGATIPATPVPLRVIGVAAPRFHGVRLGERVDVWIPRALTRRVALGGMARDNPPLLAMARLAPGVSVAGAQQAMYADWRVSQATGPSPPPGVVRAPSTPPMGFSFVSGLPVPLALAPITRVFGSPTSRTLVVGEDGVLFVAMLTAILVLLGGCATLMVLVLVSCEQRRQEFAVRMALGCSRTRLMTALLVELTAILTVGAVAAMGLAVLGVRALPALSLPGGLEITRLDLTPDWRLAAFGVLGALVTLALAGTGPLLRSTRPVLASDLALSSGRSTPSSYRARRVLLAAQVAATVIVLVAAHLFVVTVRDGFTRSPGFDVDRTLFVELQARSMYMSTRAEGEARLASVAQRLPGLLDALRRVPGVELVAIGRAPLGLDQAILATRPTEVETASGTRTIRLSGIGGTPEYLQALGANRLAGRLLTTADIRTGTAERPCVITASLAQALWPDGAAIGQRFKRGLPFEVVGIVSDIAQGSLRLDQRAAVFSAWSIDQGASAEMVSLTLRVTGDPTAFSGPIREAITSTFGTLPRVEVSTGREVVARDLGRERLGAWFFSGFGLVALALGAGGVFGLVAHLVAARRREFGVRLALGATPQSVMGLALSAGIQPVTVGVVVGVAAAAGLAATVRASLTGIRPLDLPAALTMPLVMLACAAGAGLIAAWRVRRISALEALRAE